MKTKFKLGQKVYHVGKRKIDGRVNTCKVVGVELLGGSALYYFSEADFLSQYSNQHVMYKIAYVDVFTGRTGVEWVFEKELSTNKKEVVE